MCGIVGILGQKAVAGDLVDALRRLEYRGYDFGRRRHRRERPSRAPPRRGQAQEPRAAALQPAPAGPRRHRPHALGHARPADRAQRPPAHERARLGGPQRHHRELRRAARRADRQGPPLRDRDGHRGGGAPHHRRHGQGKSPIEAAKAALQQPAGRLRAGHHLRRRGRPDDRRPQGQPAGHRPRPAARCTWARTPSRSRPSPARSPIWRKATGRC